MKSRNGFISNSSTSSFIIMYNGVKPETQELVKEIREAANKTVNSDEWFYMSEPQFVCNGLMSISTENGSIVSDNLNRKYEPNIKWYVAKMSIKYYFRKEHPELGQLFDKFTKNTEYKILEEM